MTVETDQGPLIFQAEIADSVDERTRGLMFRESMGDDQGMLFLFPREQQLSFWMKNTFIPLDIIFIRSDRTILGIAENAVPQTMTSRRVPGNSQFVLEINGGLSAQRAFAPVKRCDSWRPSRIADLIGCGFRPSPHLAGLRHDAQQILSLPIRKLDVRQDVGMQRLRIEFEDAFTDRSDL